MFSLWTKLIFMLYYKKALLFDIKRREFIAKIMADFGKTIFAVGLASYFFEKFSSNLKLVLWLICLIALVASVFVHPRKTEGV